MLIVDGSVGEEKGRAGMGPGRNRDDEARQSGGETIGQNERVGGVGNAKGVGCKCGAERERRDETEKSPGKPSKVPKVVGGGVERSRVGRVEGDERGGGGGKPK